MHDNLCITKNEEPPGLLTDGGRSDKDDPRGEVVLTACRERTMADSPTCCEKQVQPAAMLTASSSASTSESTNSVWPLELQVEGSGIEDNSTSSSVKTGEDVDLVQQFGSRGARR